GDQPQELTTTLLDFPITVRATPTQYTWDFGDGSTPLTTTDPGAPFPADGHVDAGRYPDGVIGYPYPHLGTFTITLTTTWAGQYQVAGTTTWLPVTGTATTTTTHTPVTVLESRTHLVAENCHQNPTGPGC
ncbi:PKD domain-containing protein, partial [Cellulomonas sp. P22]|uniref:PKD domain-containing protein n=1 Tax=Cellulomonas sp. P22 TaxID=3373189 RepID=UPI0037A2C180